MSDLAAGLRGLLLATMLLAFTGCFGTNPDDAEKPLPSETASSSESQSMTTTTQVSLPPPPVQSNGIALSNCSWVQAAWTIPPAAHSGQRPPEWEPADETTLFGGVGLDGFRCQRVRVGLFERGPMHLLVESHSAASFPPECMRGGSSPSGGGLITTFWIDDAEIAQHLNETYGLPVIVAVIQETDESLGSVQRHTWTWNQEGQPASMLTMANEPASADGSLDLKYFWTWGDLLVRLRVDYETQSSFARFEQGAFQPPMLMASIAAGNFVGVNAWSPDGDGIGEFTVYRDRFCEEPLP